MIAVVYKIVNTVNGKFYLGSSVNFTRRSRRHFETLKANRHHSKPLQNAFNKYGGESFTVKVIEEFAFTSRNDILIKEQQLGYRVSIEKGGGITNYCKIKRGKQNIADTFSHKYKIEAVWLAVVEFIIWYK